MPNLNICYAVDENYIEQLIVSITSILKNANINDILNFYIMENGLTEEQKYCFNKLKKIQKFNINFIKIDKSDFIKCPLLKENNENYKDYHVTIPTYFRFNAPKYFPILNKILYLDCDVIIRTSLHELFDIDIENYSAMMVEDASNATEKERLKINQYFNAGVMMINLNYWRQNNITNKLFEYAIEHKNEILWQDQDIINKVLNNKILSINKEWNYQYFLYEYSNAAELKNAKILHYAGRFKPWLMHFESSIYDIYYYYLSFTDYKKKIIEYKLKANNKSLIKK